jgi:hypothetical protein
MKEITGTACHSRSLNHISPDYFRDVTLWTQIHSVAILVELHFIRIELLTLVCTIVIQNFFLLKKHD